MVERVYKWARRVYTWKKGYFPHDADYAASLLIHFLKRRGLTQEQIGQLSDRDVKHLCNSFMEDGKPPELGRLMANEFVEEWAEPTPISPMAQAANEMLRKAGYDV